mmetsp:Transcript_125469/g.313460  ORF Transcript_125469/g.313460 Transcript_125469/m.313460 type:complete len:277 (-) Transcript_125469:1-831(-)
MAARQEGQGPAARHAGLEEGAAEVACGSAACRGRPPTLEESPTCLAKGRAARRAQGPAEPSGTCPGRKARQAPRGPCLAQSHACQGQSPEARQASCEGGQTVLDQVSASRPSCPPVLEEGLEVLDRGFAPCRAPCPACRAPGQAPLPEIGSGREARQAPDAARQAQGPAAWQSVPQALVEGSFSCLEVGLVACRGRPPVFEGGPAIPDRGSPACPGHPPIVGGGQAVLEGNQAAVGTARRQVRTPLRAPGRGSGRPGAQMPDRGATASHSALRMTS